MKLPLDRYDRLPEALAGISAREIRSVFPNPSLVFIAGEDPQPLFISTLLHGNELTSFSVLQHLERACRQSPPPRSLIIFVGNVGATEAGVRHLDDTPDFNRIWANGHSPWHELAGDVMAEARGAGLFASIDIHNNTGDNPLYGCVNALRPADLQLAAMFAPVGVYYLNPPTTQSIAFSRICPAITVECGKTGNTDGIDAAIRLVEGAMRLKAFDPAPPGPDALKVYHTVGRVLIPENVSFGFGEAGVQLVLREDLEAKNFRPMPAGADWADTELSGMPLSVVDEHGNDLTDEFFCRDGRALKLVQDVVPSMITRNKEVIRQDCLGYLMRPI
ncbi:MAG: succinylglutamate desuccinylase/aspartoacylase family protein [Hyphomonas sp.]|uniref:succinylglutamate desuccinylase/aspartoacylase domain-containing protein n=1 Tax=Hyphomonas sp. TaxID=87 RepID=UPI00352887E7